MLGIIQVGLGAGACELACQTVVVHDVSAEAGVELWDASLPDNLLTEWAKEGKVQTNQGKVHAKQGKVLPG